MECQKEKWKSYFLVKHISEEESWYEAYKNLDRNSRDFSEKRHLNRITSSDSDIGKRSDNKCNVDTTDHILEELDVEEQRKVTAEDSTIQFSEWN